MKAIFNCLGIQTSTEKISTDQQEISFFYINNPDGTIRWAWNKNCSKPIFLQFYNANNWKAKLFIFLVKLVFALRLQQLFYHQKTFYANHIYSFFDITKEWAIFTGTVGPNRKAILLQNNYFYKIGLTQNAVRLLSNEYHFLEYLQSTNIDFVTPHAIFIKNNILKINNINVNGVRNNHFTEKHQEFIIQLNKLNQKEIQISNFQHFNILKNSFNNIRDERFPKNFIKKLQIILNEINVKDKISINFTHGDFTPWNCLEVNNQIGVYDWELAKNYNTKGFDYFHFIIQNNILVHKKPWKKIYEELINNSDFNHSFFGNTENFEKYLKWYLLNNILYHISLYHNQEKWHVQINWLIETWNEALNIFLTKKYNHRQLLIMDVFDKLKEFEYAALKFEIDQPEDLSFNSDIDFIIYKKDYKSIVRFLTKHSLVKNYTGLQKKFMASINLQTIDGNILALDFIWQLKYKNLEILNAEECIKTNVVKPNGISVVNSNLTAQYIGLFYILNKAYIPTKYWHYHQNLNLSKPFDLIIYKHYLQFQENNKHLFTYLNSLEMNKKFNYIKNTFNYIIDTLTTIYHSKGFVITFSGVDGAGKSTIIDNIAQIIEKKYRKNIKVLRHRPSILPILSVYSKGKKEAQRQVINSLPRQGTNNSKLSSLLRFLYYYTDYVLGQFYIYLKYTLRGTIVIYDRYYFDFINDSKRSNICLPKFITKSGYIFLIKPKYNFFLYADPETILKRKQELDANTIQTLTKEYQELFQHLNKQNKKNTYLSISNIELNNTINQIINTLTIQSL